MILYILDENKEAFSRIINRDFRDELQWFTDEL
jgi:hypothetical protein